MNETAAPGHARALDAADPLAGLREQFHLPRRADGTPQVYFCGHSLGLAPRQAARIVNEELDSWARRAVEGHFEAPRPWLSYHEQLTAGLARLAGAQPIEVAAMNSLTVNLHLMLVSFYRPTQQRHRIVIEQQSFPSDRYAVASHIRQHGFDPVSALIEVGPRPGETYLRTADICDLLERDGRSIATLVLPGVQYLSGQWLDLKTIAECGRRHGCRVGFDLAHAIGNVPLQLHDWNADFAVWCSYKYLNAGPGAIGGCFVHERHARDTTLPRFAGWWGHDKATRFQMPQAFDPLPGVEGWQISNPPILSAAPLIASLGIFDSAGIQGLRNKSLQLTGYLEALLMRELAGELTILTPADPAARGCQLSLRLHRPPAAARAVHERLTQRGFICDWREPDVIRAAPVPLYNSFADVLEFAQALRQELR